MFLWSLLAPISYQKNGIYREINCIFFELYIFIFKNVQERSKLGTLFVTILLLFLWPGKMCLFCLNSRLKIYINKSEKNPGFPLLFEKQDLIKFYSGFDPLHQHTRLDNVQEDYCKSVVFCHVCFIIELSLHP